MSTLSEISQPKSLLSISKATDSSDKRIRKRLPQTSLSVPKLKSLRKLGEPVMGALSFSSLKDSEKTTDYSLGGINIKVTLRLKTLLDYLAIHKPMCLILRTQPGYQNVYRSLYMPSKLKPVHSELEIHGESVFVMHSYEHLHIDIASALYNPQTKMIGESGQNLCKVTEKSQWKKPELLPSPFLCSSISLPDLKTGKTETSVRHSKLKQFKLSKNRLKKTEFNNHISPAHSQSLAPRPFVLKDGTGGYRIDQLKKTAKMIKDLPSFNTKFPVSSFLPPISSNVDLECSDIESRVNAKELKKIYKEFKTVTNKLDESSIHSIVENTYFLDSILLSGVPGIEEKVDWENFCLFYVLFVLQKPTFFEVVQFIIWFFEVHTLKHAKRSRLKRILAVISPILNQLEKDNALELRNTCKAFKTAGLSLLDMRFFVSELAKMYQLNKNI